MTSRFSPRRIAAGVVRRLKRLTTSPLETELEALRARVLDLERARARLLKRPDRRRVRPVPVTLGFDIEFDRRVVDLKDPSWRATPRLFDLWDRLREDLSSIAPLPITWYPRADPQVEKASGSLDWALRHFEPDWIRFQRRGDEIGLHMHPWRWVDVAGHWTQDHGDEQWVMHCLQSSIDAYCQVFGEPPRAYRGGDRFMTMVVARALVERGVKVDLTLEHMPTVERLVESEHGTGSIPGGETVPSQAYIASSDDVRLPATDAGIGLAMLPLTAGASGTLVPWSPPQEFCEMLNRLLSPASDEGLPTHLAFIARSDLADLPQWEAFATNIRTLAERAEEGDLAFVTASDAMRAALGHSVDSGQAA